MGRFTVLRALSFAYGHRIRGHQGPCRHLHGHNARVEVICGGDLDPLGMVVDFAAIGTAIGTWIDRNWDHRMILERGDPWVEQLRTAGEPVFVLDAPPTAENLARRLFEVAREAELPVREVRLWEGDRSMAAYGDREAE